MLKNEIAYVANIFILMNKVNKKLQSEMITLIRCKSVIKTLIPKLSFYKENKGRNVLSQFPNLCENNTIEDEWLRYCSHLHNLV